jgi:signal transduction histidine kinase
MKDITERKRTEEEKARSQRLLLALSRAAQAMQRARTPEDVYAIMSEEIARLGHNATVFTLTDDRAHLAVHHMTFKPALVRTVEKLTGLSAQGYRFPLVPGGHFQRVITEGETKFASGKLAAEYLAEALPTPVRPLARQTTTLLGIERSIVAPLTVSGETLGVLAVSGTDLSELVVPAVDAFANQAAIAIENARLYQKVRRDADQLEERVAERTRELATLYSVTALTSQSLELQATLERALAQVLAAVESDIGTIHLLDEADGSLEEKTMRLVVQRGVPTDLVPEIESIPPKEKPAWWVVEHNEPLLVPDVTSDPRMASPPLTEPWSYLGMPMRAGGQTLGVLSLVRRMGQPQFNVEELSLLTSIADQLGTAVESARLRQRAEQAARREERERLGRDLHDSITQLLYGMNLFAKSGRNAYDLGDMDELSHCLTELGEIGQQAIREMRLLVFELRPSALERDGLIGALRRRLDAVEGRVDMATQLRAGEVALPKRIEEGLYHIAMEALNNALTHAQATSVSVSLDADSEGIHLEVVDNGSGFDPHAVEGKGGLGLVNMRQRADRLGGALTIASAPGEGTRVKVTVAPK